MERVSIIIPAYNAEEYIIACLESLEKQTYENIEIVVVDDGSTDNTYSLVEEYSNGHSNVVLFHQENGGVCSARNKGLDIATGKYIMFLDSDDTISFDSIKYLYDNMVLYEAQISAGCLTGNEEEMEAVNDFNSTIWSGEKGVLSSIEDNPFTYSSCAKLYEKNVLDGVRFVEGRKIHEDSYFIFCIMLKNPTVVVSDKPVYFYRSNPNGASKAIFSDKFFDILYFANEKYRAIEERYPHLLDKAKNMLVKAHLAMLHCFCRTKDKKYNKDIKQSIREVKRYRKHFIPAIPRDKRFFTIVRLGLFWLYRRLYWLKYPLK